MVRNKMWSILLAILLVTLVFVFTGCSSAGNVSPTESAKTPEASSITSVAPSSEVSDSYEVTLWTWSPIPRTMEKMIEAFESKNPGITINYTNYNYSPEYLAAMASASASNSLPDILGLQPGALTAQYMDYLVPLDSYAEEAWGADWKVKFYKINVNQLTLGNSAGDEQIYLLPCESEIIHIWYNKKLFEEVGAKKPTTWEEFIDAAHKLTEAGYAPLYQGGADGWQNINMYLMLTAQTAPGQIFKAEDGETPWTSDGFVKAMEKWKEMFDDGIFQIGALSNHSYPDGVNLFSAGKVGMMQLGSWWLQEFTAADRTEAVENWDFEYFYLPPIEEGLQTSPPIGGVDFGYGVTKNCTNIDAAWKVIESFSVGDGVQEAINDLNDLPAAKGIAPTIDLPENMLSQFEEYTSKLDVTENMRFKNPAIETALQDALAGVASGELEPLAALEKVQQVTDEVHGK